jgi:hypothetical protein
MEFMYTVIAIYDDCRSSVETNDVNIAIRALFNFAADGAVVDVVSGCTGEVLASANYEENYITEEWKLMIAGWLIKYGEEPV